MRRAGPFTALWNTFRSTTQRCWGPPGDLRKPPQSASISAAGEGALKALWAAVGVAPRSCHVIRGASCGGNRVSGEVRTERRRPRSSISAAKLPA